MSLDFKEPAENQIELVVLGQVVSLIQEQKSYDEAVCSEGKEVEAAN